MGNATVVEQQIVLAKRIDDFFLRSSLTTQDRVDCFDFVKRLYPSSLITTSSSQGYCSLTVFVDDDKVIQFRPHGYRLDLRITSAAQEVYGRFAPETKCLGTVQSSGLHVYVMDRIKGICFRDAKNFHQIPTEQLESLCKDFAVFVSQSWKRRGQERFSLGLVGKSIRSRLISLCTHLPLRFRELARSLLHNIHQIEALPWVLTHGDIVAANIIVDTSSNRLVGFVDWAEAEILPFGICFYGLEEILGQMTPQGFEYHSDASILREVFWETLAKEIPELRNMQILEAVKLARDLGMLLWHGIAFDDGSIDRVVEEVRDIEEICRLDAFLDLKPDKARM